MIHSKDAHPQLLTNNLPFSEFAMKMSAQQDLFKTLWLHRKTGEDAKQWLIRRRPWAVYFFISLEQLGLFTFSISARKQESTNDFSRRQNRSQGALHSKLN